MSRHTSRRIPSRRLQSDTDRICQDGKNRRMQLRGFRWSSVFFQASTLWQVFGTRSVQNAMIVLPKSAYWDHNSNLQTHSCLEVPELVLSSSLLHYHPFSLCAPTPSRASVKREKSISDLTLDEIQMVYGSRFILKGLYRVLDLEFTVSSWGFKGLVLN